MDPCIRHKHRDKKRHHYDTIDQYQCKASCIGKMEKSRLSLFVKKVWVQKVVKEVVKELPNLGK